MNHSLSNIPSNLSAKEKLSLALGTLSGLSSVESLIAEKFASEAPLLTEIPKYLFKLGGKRIRPMLTLLVSQALGAKSPPSAVIEVAAGIELIHMATLLHDDIIDKSPLRRHKQSPFVKYGTPDTLLAGDFLLVRAFSLCAHLDRAIIDATEQACIELTEGEILEIPLSQKIQTTAQSETIARKKTAALFRLATFSASHIVTEGNAKLTSLFSQFGEDLGIAFQILDDVLDVTSTEDLLGKKAGTDIREQKPSAINVRWLESKSPRAKDLLLGKEPIQDSSIDAALQELKDSPVVKECRERAQFFAKRAAASLAQCREYPGPKDEKAFEALNSLTAYILDRSE